MRTSNVYKKYIKSLAEYIDRNSFKLRPFPKVIIDRTEQDGVFIRTGHYDFNKQEITIYVNGRHIKDILRSVAHELVHHNQYLEGKIKPEKIDGDKLIGESENVKYLNSLEEDAYLRGNIAFRKWTEVEKGKGRKIIFIKKKKKLCEKLG